LVDRGALEFPNLPTIDPQPSELSKAKRDLAFAGVLAVCGLGILAIVAKSDRVEAALLSIGVFLLTGTLGSFAISKNRVVQWLERNQIARECSRATGSDEGNEPVSSEESPHM
jgi:hypothetical protein